MTDIKFSPCPFCGAVPDVSTAGTFLDVECAECGAYMGFQKCDYLTLEERQTRSDDPAYPYGPEAERKVLRVAAMYWNRRTPSV